MIAMHVKSALNLLFFLFQFILLTPSLHGNFLPDHDDYEAYGLKIAMNEQLLVQAHNHNSSPTFFIRFPPYNDTHHAFQCSIPYPSPSDMFTYAVAVGKRQSQKHFVFAGELINGKRGTFVGAAVYTGTHITSNRTKSSTNMCHEDFTYFIQYFYGYDHQEQYLIDVEPSGWITFGFSNQFLFVFDIRNTSDFIVWNGNVTWPDQSFIPYAVDISETFGVIAGFIKVSDGFLVKYAPIIYLFKYDRISYTPVVIDQYEPKANPNTWQALLTNEDASTFSSKYLMSVDINDNGDVLIGMQFINRVFLFSVNRTRPTRLVYVTRHTYGRSLGNGKSVAWLEHGLAAILVNTHSLDYQWSSSQIHIYDIQRQGYNSNSTPLSIFPNSHQLLPPYIKPTFLSLVSSPKSLVLLDNQGNLLIFNPTPPGSFPSVRDTGVRPLITTPQICPPGTFKNQTGIHDCMLCPPHTKNPGNQNMYCVPCRTDSFCPLGAADEVPKSALATVVQALAYPKSPDSTSFDEILLENMFSLKFGPCLYVSPLFWTLIVGFLSIVVIIVMSILKFHIQNPQSRSIRKFLKVSLKHIDVINEGELWLGGLASIAVLVLSIFAFIFSYAYLQRYPIENPSESSIVCDESIKNAKFETTVQLLAIPFSTNEQDIVDLFNKQAFMLNVDFVNTMINCDAISIQAFLGTSWSTIRWLACFNNNSILSLTIPLPFQQVAVQLKLADTKTIGGLRVGLYGPGKSRDHSTLRTMNFSRSFYKDEHVLAQNLLINLDMTKIINETLPLSDDESDFAGIFVPTFKVDIHSLFVSLDQYIRSSLTSTTLTVMLGETPYYVKNTQQPIAKQSEILFHNILFFIVCLELFGLLFLLYKIVLRPILKILFFKSSASLRR